MVGIIARILLAASLVGGTCLGVNAQQTASVTVSVKNHRFQPTEIHAPPNVPIELRVKNLDSAPMEFESVSLRVEKVVTGNGEGIIRLRPLAPGRYEFFDDFHPETRGALVTK
ncbi:MAG TPA: cupredoxin domain-containing protein [Pseudolabrys sp.]|nr:cupredoxin domain-containing protein [Pseudolabrys sp.]